MAERPPLGQPAAGQRTVDGAARVAPPAVALGALGLDRGAHLLIQRALRQHPQIHVTGVHPALGVHLAAWCRSQGHRCVPAGRGFLLSGAPSGRWVGAEAAGTLAQPVDAPPARWGLAARGARVEQGPLVFHFPLSDKDELWADEAARMYRKACAAQWDPDSAIDWQAPVVHGPEVEDAVVQVMTYLIENELAALQIPARFLARMHPHFREVIQLLAVQAADEARHVEVFTRRAELNRSTLGLSSQGGQASLKTLLDEPDWALASFLLSVLGEGSFLELLWFLRDHGPDPITRQVARLAAIDEARHVGFGMAHLGRHASLDPTLRPRLALAIERRHSSLADTAGLNQEVFDALVLLAAGSWEPDDIAAGWDRVAGLKQRMDRGRRTRLERLGFPVAQAAALSQLHTRNFM